MNATNKKIAEKFDYFYAYLFAAAINALNNPSGRCGRDKNSG